MMINAKKELLEILVDIKPVCADITCQPDYDTEISIVLLVGYTAEDYSVFLDKLDFEYDCGYGMQHLFGTVWLPNNEWLERYEYDGSESWTYMQYPEIPDYLQP